MNLELGKTDRILAVKKINQYGGKRDMASWGLNILVIACINIRIFSDPVKI